LEKSNISELSVVSDAGDQQHIRQRILTRVEEVRYNGDEQLGSFPTPLERHELQKVIFSAIEDTWNPDIPHLDAGILPNAQLRRLINPNSVFRELTKDMTYVQVQEEGDSIWKIALDVCAETEVLHDGKEKIKSFRKVFAALVLAESSALISLFIKEGVSDLDLPLVTYGDRRRMELRRRDTFDQPSKKSLECFKHPSWSPVKIDTFKREQWKMLAPFFSQGDCGDVKHYPLMNQRILPFMASHLPNDKVVEHRGGFGKVFIVHIHKDHHNFGDALACSRGFAVKQLYEDDREAFDKERKILKRFSGDRSHRHVVSLLATYEHLGKFHLIFHAAEADLLKFWKHRSFNTQFEPDSIKWMARQCAGIAHGLLQLHRHITFVRSSSYPDVEEELVHKPSGESQVRIQLPTHLKREVFRSSSNDTETPDSSRRIDDSHQYFVEPRIRSVQRTFTEELKQETKFGRHGDINPQNILLYHDSDEDNDSLTGTLKLSDFGEAEINSRFSRSKRRSVANTLTYRPPECDLSPRIIRQSYDIWCLGCVYLEFVTWMLGGYQLLCRFSKYRRSPDIFQPGQETDTFFQVVISAENDHPGVMVKPKVTKVSIP
jgi:serine/threonine protein kinase